MTLVSMDANPISLILLLTFLGSILHLPLDTMMAMASIAVLWFMDSGYEPICQMDLWGLIKLTDLRFHILFDIIFPQVGLDLL